MNGRLEVVGDLTVHARSDDEHRRHAHRSRLPIGFFQSLQQLNVIISHVFRQVLLLLLLLFRRRLCHSFAFSSIEFFL